MPNGDHQDVWRAIDSIRDRQTAQEARTAVNESQVADIRNDISHVSRKVSVSEAHVKEYVDASVGNLTQKIDRGVIWLRWVAGIAIPMIAALAGALISRVFG